MGASDHPGLGRPAANAAAAPAEGRAAKPSRRSLALPAGFRLHEYRIDRVLGQGGFGITYLATDVHLNARVAIKEYLPQQIAFRTSDRTVSANATEHLSRYRHGLDGFLVEARTLASFRHPHIVRVARFFEAHQTAYMVLEYERGQPLKQWWTARHGTPPPMPPRAVRPDPSTTTAAGRAAVPSDLAAAAAALIAPAGPDDPTVLSPAVPAPAPAPKDVPAKATLSPADAAREAELLRLLLPLLDGLAVVHDAGFLHRDIKPDNIHVREDGSWVLLDFGSARASAQVRPAGGDDDEPGDIVVTPGYAPIEQYLDDAQGAWTDLYAFGATLYWLVTGRKPPGADARQRRQDPMVPAVEAGRGRYSEAFLAAVDWALRPRAQDRPQRVADWRRALCAGQAGALDLSDALQASAAGDASEGQGWSAWRQLRWRRGPKALAADLRRLLSPSHWTLAGKLGVGMLAVALVPMVLVGAMQLRGSLEAVAGGELRNLEQLARSTAGRLSQLIGDSQKLSRAIGTDPAFVRYLADAGGDDRATDTAALRGKLVAIAASNPDIHLLMLMDPRGTAVVSSDPEVMGRSFAFREYFKAAMAGREHVTGIVVGAVAGQAGMFFSTPVRAADGSVLGAVVLRLRASAVSAILDEVRAGTARVAWLVDATGVVLHHADPAWLYRSLVPLAPDALAEIRADQRFRRNDIQSLDMPEFAQSVVGASGEGHVEYASPRDGSAEIAGFAPVRGHPWVVAVSESRALFEAPLTALFQRLAWSLAAVGLVAGGLAWWMARALSRPIRALTDAAESLKRGDYDGATLVVRTRDEIGQLARTFNVLIDVLRQREREGRAAPGRERGGR